jgi:carboxypeptidase PM20D1
MRRARAAVKVRIRKALKIVALALAALSAVCVGRAALLEPPAFEPGAAPDLPAFDEARAARRLGEAIAIPTVSLSTGGDPEAFDRLHALLRDRYPRVFSTLEVEAVGPSRILRWRGREPDLEPVLLTAHLDVVPVEPGTEGAWTQPPFSGASEGGFVWGRGAMDDKTAVIGILEAVEAMLAEGTTPRRTIVIAFGHDEEVGGEEGAAAIARRLGESGERYAFVLDEGGAILSGGLPGVSQPVAFVGIAEKGYASVQLSVVGEGGHSSMPPARSAIGRLAEAVVRVEGSPMPLSLQGPTRAMLDTLAPHMSFGPRVAMANLWLLDGVVARVLASQPAANATVRTTTAPTMFDAGTAENVLASRAQAIVNFRILPGETVDDVLAHVRDVVDDPAIEVRCVGVCRDPSPVSPADGEGFTTIRRAIAHVFPDVLVAPHLVVGGTDARHYVALSDEVYRFLPIALDDADRSRLHGTDERISVAGLGTAVKFYATILALAAG